MLINNAEAFYASISTFTPRLFIDTETTGLKVWFNDRIVGVGVRTDHGDSYYYPFRHVPKNPLLDEIDGPLNLPIDLLPLLLEQFAHCETWVGHNTKFDMAVCWQDGFEPPEQLRVEDTVGMGRLYFMDEFDELSLEAITEHFFPETMANSWKQKFKEHMRKGKMKSYAEVHPTIMAEYCEMDCENTKKIYHKLLDHIVKTEQTRVFDQECELIKTVWEMEKVGFHADKQYAERMIPKLERKIEKLRREICAGLEQEVNISSHPQLTQALNAKHIFSPKKTKAGKQAWDEEAMKLIPHPVCHKILEYKGVQKMLTTYFEPVRQLDGDWFHPSLNPFRAVTGRFSCSNPNLQNQTNGTIVLGDLDYDEAEAQRLREGRIDESATFNEEYGFFGVMKETFDDEENEVNVKRLYVAPEGYEMWLFDYDQMEMRKFADYTRDPVMIDALENKHFDYHTHVAGQVWNAFPGQPNFKRYRKIAKAVNFGLIFGVGREKLAMKIGQTPDQAQAYKMEYFSKMPYADYFIQKVHETVINRGYVVNRFGRRYYIPADKAYVGVNYLIQGSCADIVKNRMIACGRWLKQNGCLSRLVVQVHDELIFYVHHSERSFVPKHIKEILEERQIKTFLPCKAEVASPSWAQKKPMCVDCLAQLTKEEDSGAVQHVCSGS